MKVIYYILAVVFPFLFGWAIVIGTGGIIEADTIFKSEPFLVLSMIWWLFVGAYAFIDAFDSLK